MRETGLKREGSRFTNGVELSLQHDSNLIPEWVLVAAREAREASAVDDSIIDQPALLHEKQPLDPRVEKIIDSTQGTISNRSIKIAEINTPQDQNMPNSATELYPQQNPGNTVPLPRPMQPSWLPDNIREFPTPEQADSEKRVA